MKPIERLESLHQEITSKREEEILQSLLLFLEQLTHDLNNTLSALGLELFNARGAVDKLAGAVRTADLGGVDEQARAMASIVANLQDTVHDATEMLGAIDELTIGWSETSDENT